MYIINLELKKIFNYILFNRKSKQKFKNSKLILFISDTGIHPYFPVSENSEVFVADGDHIGLKCVPEGNPKPQVTWHLPGNLTRNVSCFFV